MKQEILNNLDYPDKIEALYRNNKADFKNAFKQIYPEIQHHLTARVWNERLNFEQSEISWGSQKEVLFVIIAAVIAGFIAKLPELFSMNEDSFYYRNLGFVVFPILSAYFAWKGKLNSVKIIWTISIILVSVIFINLLPQEENSDTLKLACIHLPILLWGILGFTYVGSKFSTSRKRLDFLKYNGDLVVMSTVILIAGAILAGITLGLFELIELHIEEFYFQYFGIWGIAAIPIIATHLVETNPHLVNKVSPVIAKIFTPLVLITLVVYLVAIVYTGKDPYNDREFLLFFNLLLIGVMAIILFSIAETSRNSSGKTGTILLLMLSVMTIIVNGTALSAILFRISTWGITPNRLAVLVGNLLILINLLMVTYSIFKSLKHHDKKEDIEKSITSYLPVYIAWTAIVVFLFPFIFNFR
ncbi:MAG: DUF4153 domain-containing protein [Sphingobacteriia bacterium]|nr:DUF4153 domain-containing protein [Sphingobacteriia bacterium]